MKKLLVSQEMWQQPSWKRSWDKSHKIIYRVDIRKVTSEVICPRATENLLSIMTILSTGIKFHSNDANDTHLTKATGIKLTFHCHIIACNDRDTRVEITPLKHYIGANINEVAPLANEKEAVTKTMKHECIKNVNDLHKELGHPIEATTRSIGANIGIKVVGNFIINNLF